MNKTLFGFLICVCIAAIPGFQVHAAGSHEPPDPSHPLYLVINYPYQIWSNDPTKIHVTIFTPDFRPAKSARVTVNGKSVGTTDANGTLFFDYKPGANNEHILEAIYSEGGKSWSVEKRFASNSRTESFQADILYVYTDRGIYNPGQDILCRIIAWTLKGEYSPNASARVQLILQDKGGKVYSGGFVATNEFGIGSMTLAVSRNMPEGDYELVVLHEKARESASIRIKRFTPPVINIAHNLKRYMTDIEDSLPIDVGFSSFTGGTIGNSTLVLSVLDPEKKEIFKKKYTSAIEYKIKLDKKELDSFRQKLTEERGFTIRIVATDSYGNSDELDWDMTYTTNPYTCVVELDKDSYPAGEKVQALIKIKDLDGQPAKKIQLMIECDGLGEKKKGVTDDKGTALFAFTMPNANAVLTVSSPIVKKPLSQTTLPLEAMKPMVSKAEGLPAGAGLSTKISVAFDPGYVPVEKIVHIDLTDISGALVWSGTIPIEQTGGAYKAAGEITAPTWGSMLVNLYCCAVEKKNGQSPLSSENVGFITEGQHVTFYAEKGLEIVVENFKPESAPGEKTKFTVSVKGGVGEKCLGVSVTDAAVLSLLDPFIKKPTEHFYNPQAKVISTGGAAVLTWPVVDRNWGSPWRDIAYTDWGWKAPGNPVLERTVDGSNEASGEAMAAPSTAKSIDDFMADESVLTEKNAKEEVKPAAMANGKPDDRKRNGESSPPSEKKIVIRTRFEETSFWNPALITKNNKADFTVTMPDELTVQRVSVLATDRSGYIALFQKDVRITQPLFVRSHAPASMKLGDEITFQTIVRNMTIKPVSALISLKSDRLAVGTAKPQEITISANESAITEWKVKAFACGNARYSVTVDSKDFSDSEEKELFVLPSGEPGVTEYRSLVKGGDTSETKFTFRKGTDYRIASVSIALPNVFPAIEAIRAFTPDGGLSPWGIAASAIMNAAMLKYVRSTHGPQARIDEISRLLSDASATLTASQLSSGGWNQFLAPDSAGRSQSKGNLYVTLHCLRALAELKDSGIAVGDDPITKAMSYVLASRNDDGLWSAKNAYFWDVYNENTDKGLSAEAFEVLTLAFASVSPQAQFDNDLVRIKDKIMKIYDSGIEEPLFLASAVRGLLVMMKTSGGGITDSFLRTMIDRLIRTKRTTHWEPHWYHAYGGMVELNARILTLLAEFDPEGYAASLREGVTWLLATRSAWFSWHNELGTASAITALLAAGVFAREIPCDITLSVNGRVVERIKIDPDDPFLSAARLARRDVTEWCIDGENTIAVRYTGKLEASCVIETREWPGKAAEKKQTVVLERTLPSSAAVGQPVSVKFRIKITGTVPVMTIRDTVPSNTTVDEKSIEKLVTNGTITGFTIEGSTLTFGLADATGTVDVGFKLMPILKGISSMDRALAFNGVSGELVGMSDKGSFTVVP